MKTISRYALIAHVLMVISLEAWGAAREESHSAMQKLSPGAAAATLGFPLEEDIEAWYQFGIKLLESYIPEDDAQINEMLGDSLPIYEVHSKPSKYILKYDLHRLTTHFALTQVIKTNQNLKNVRLVKKYLVIGKRGERKTIEGTNAYIRRPEFKRELLYALTESFFPYSKFMIDAVLAMTGAQVASAWEEEREIIIICEREQGLVKATPIPADWYALRDLRMTIPFDLGIGCAVNFAYDGADPMTRKIVLFDTEPGIVDNDPKQDLTLFMQSLSWPDPCVVAINWDLKTWDIERQCDEIARIAESQRWVIPPWELQRGRDTLL